MLSDEEKKAIDTLKILIQYLSVWKENFTIAPEDVKYLIPILNLIEKKSKEIEELKDESKEYQIGFAQGCYEKDLEWRDKIKAKIEEVDYKMIAHQDLKLAVKEALNSLLEKE